jgi:methyl-accepting chemotaxis protein
MISFGVLMGFVFPVYARFFVEWKEGMLLYFVIGCIVAGITVGVVSYSFVKIILLKPLLKVSDVANKLKNKDITGYIDLVSKDSVGDIISGINASCENIKAFLTEINISASINEQILDQVKLDGHADNDSIIQTIRTVTESTKLISKHSNQICFTMVESLDSVKDWQIRLDGMIQHIGMLSTSMESLNTNANKINSILSMVEDIARRTNLVSVNATIEAASAGELGKSFSVVANEIRDLANNVSLSAGDISGYTKTISTNIASADKSVKEIYTLIEQNKESSITLKTNLDNIEEIAKSNYRADKQLVSSVESLNKAFAAIDDVLKKLSESTSSFQQIISAYNY